MAPASPGRKLIDPFRVFLVVLVIIFCTEVSVMLLLGPLLTRLEGTPLALLDALLLSLIVAPFLWAFIVHPLKRQAATAKEQSATVLEHAAEGILTVDGYGKVTTMNPAAEAMFGISKANAAGRSWALFIADNGLPTDEQSVLPFVNTDKGSPIGKGVDAIALRADSSTFEAEVMASPMGDERHPAFVCIVRDVSWRKAAEREVLESRSMLQSVLDTIPVRVFWKDTDSVYLGANRAFAEDAGIDDPVIMIGKTDFDFTWRDQADMYRADDAEVMRTSTTKLHYEEPQTTPDGDTIWLRTSKIPLQNADGQVFGVLGCYEDITERKHNQKILEDTLEELEKRVEERTAELEEAKNIAEAASHAKSEFLSRTSHELRTPMHAMLGFAQLLGSNPDEPLTPGQRHQLEEILGAGNHLLQLVNEILDLSRIEAGTFDLKIRPVKLGEFVDEVVTLLTPMAREHRVGLQLPVDHQCLCDVQADPTRLKEVLFNLISNGIKYNSKDGLVTIRCGGEKDGMLGIEIADTGPGISKRLQKRIFEPFDRLGAEKSEIEGAGIGLSISRRLVEAMGGRIEIDSTSGAGSRFTVYLPAADTPAPKSRRRKRAASPAPRKVNGVKHTVLYIEDNPSSTELVREIFRRNPDLILLSEPAGVPGLDTARRESPDLILLDLNLPDLDGFEVLAQLKQEDGTADIPVVGVSANSYPEDIERARKSGFHDYITKPFNVATLLGKVESALTERKS